MSEQIQVWLLTCALTGDSTYMQRKRQYEERSEQGDGPKHWSDPATSQGTPEVIRSWKRKGV